ncbi:tyrosine-protein phosphatase [Roseateles sp. SL47]|uniref:protein-tyrosine phosphatase family protein n=1 Tax=Roseateles sp. SL47 TaxID=2995138 RepID=UPI00227164EF|nr:tyrosine-protein phosphatase [Roseateles sp. SL47]WAC75456.1 tyrosine-protein phosphatase [Roseateles sp. SL47]
MTFRALPLPDDVPGRLWLHSMPGRREPWADFLDEARQQRLNLVVCLNPLDEVAELSPAYFKAIKEGCLPFRWMHLPMLNFGLASEASAFRQGVDQLAHGLRLGDRGLVHCAAGMGRTGTMAACVLKRLGDSADSAVKAVRAAGSNPQSAVQSGWIEKF